jgi:hypothetical protein
MVLKFVNKKDYVELEEKDYDQFLEMEYFDIMIGKSTEFLKGSILKVFELKHNEQLIHTIS